MNQNHDQQKNNQKINDQNQSNFYNSKNYSANKSHNSNFASRDRKYQHYGNFQKPNYSQDLKNNTTNPFQGDDSQKFVDQKDIEIQAQNSPQYDQQSEQYVNYQPNYLKSQQNLETTQEQKKESKNLLQKVTKSKKPNQINFSWLLHDDENQFFYFLSDSRAVAEISDLNKKMQYREKHSTWTSSFYQLNSDIFQKHEKRTKTKINPVEKLWNNISFTAKSIYYSISTLLVSMLMLIFWLFFAGISNFQFWQYLTFVGSFVLFLVIIQTLVYFNNLKNRKRPRKLIFYYIADSIFLLLNYIVRLVFLLSPIFSHKLIVLNVNSELISQNLAQLNPYSQILYYIFWFPALSYFFGLGFFIVIKWSEFVKNFWFTFAIFKILSYQKLANEYKIRHDDERLAKKLKDKWIELYKIGRPLGNFLHPSFIFAYKQIKIDPNLPIEEQEKLVNDVLNIVTEDVAKYR
ncbi:hypothetical protein [Mesomycoplasma ovipneumoniae]|uniref:hypothetical protein n=1 Tax=Mesomycoplasma ovipneumoniae TaxID=29562 RepID=UPI00083E7C45|nr:hypothetical protein [Mesomycoplasma ovipneumoniae]